MTCKCKKATKAAETVAEDVLEHGSKAFEEVIDFVTPRAQHAVEVVLPVLEDARGRIVPVFKDARGRVVPVFEDARDFVAPVLEDAREFIVPRVSEVVERVPPALHHAYETVQHDVYPKIQALWDQAGENPQVAEASRRGRAAVAALRGDLVLPEPAPVETRRTRGVVGKIFGVLGLAALIGALVIAIRAVLGTSDDGWSPVEPIRREDEDEADWGDSPFGEDLATEPDVDTTQSDSDDQAEQEMLAEGAPADARNAYGEGAYVGSEPPAGYTIKGNERSMKYHVKEAAGYERTNADVWFNSEEAAQAAGFTRALR